MYSNKLVSIILCTRKRPIFLKNLINSVINTIEDTSEVEFTFIIDIDDDYTKSIIKSFPFNNLHINGEKMNYDKNSQYDKFIDMHFIITDRMNGYQDMHHRYNHAFNTYPVGKWTFILNDDVEIITKNWTDNVRKLDELHKVCIAKLNDWNMVLVQSEIPKLLGGICPNAFIDLWYDEIAKELKIYEESGIVIKHTRVENGSTAEERNKFHRELERSPKWIDNTWVGGPPSYDRKVKDEFIMQLKKYIESKNMNDNNDVYSNKLVGFFDSLNDIEKITKQDFVKKVPDTIISNFINGAFVEIIGNSNLEYTIEFIDNDTNTVVHRDILTPNRWTKTNRQWVTNWKVKIYTTELVYEHIYNSKNKKVYVHLSSESIGDTLAWFPYAEEFRKKHNCRMVCSTFHNYLFEGLYKDIEFVKPGTQVHNLYAMYEIGIYDGNHDRNKIDHKEIPLQRVAADMLGLEFKEVRPNINVNNHLDNKIYGKYVAISTESTAQCKLWNYTGGWQKVVDYLNALGYRTVVVQKSKSDLKNVIDKTGNKDLNAAIDIINGAEFFIGISSGLSWIAWALQKKSIMISGFTLPWYEYNENCYRINNIHSCKGCWHEHIFDKGNWNWCPMKKNFECSSTISPEHVFTQIQTIINEYDVMYTSESPDIPVNLTNKAIGFKFNDNKFGDAEAMFHEIFRNRTYDHYDHFIKENDVVLDVGANIGIFTRYARARKAKVIYAFEPIRENYDLLVKNNNNLPATTSTVITYNIGVSDKYEVETFYIDSNSGGHTLLDIDVNNTRTKETRKIECYSLDYMFENKIIPEKIDFMKIDAEGAEIKILKGISNENLKKINVISMEWHQFLFKDESMMNDVIDRFVDLGYNFYIDYIGNSCVTLYFWKS